jgi:hypothetical protein
MHDFCEEGKLILPGGRLEAPGFQAILDDPTRAAYGAYRFL